MTSTLIKPAPRGTLVVGRIESYIKHPEQLLPVSCTVGLLQNNLLEKHGVGDLMRFVSQGLRFGAGVALHVSEFDLYEQYDFSYRFYIDPNHPDQADFSTYEKQPPSHNDLVIKVADSMQSDDTENGGLSIESSWAEFIRLAVSNTQKIIVIDLSALRPKGQDNGKGLVASGPGSFGIIYDYIAEFLFFPTLTSLCQIFSGQNEVLRRGGIFKNGAITIHFDYDQKGALEFVSMSRSKTNWARLCLNIDENFLSLPEASLGHFFRYISKGDVFIVRKVYAESGERLRHNVCLEILLKPFGTCLLSHLNLGLLSDKEIPDAGEASVKWLCELHGQTGVENSEFYLSPEEDKQVGMGLVGFSNALAIREVTYKEFVEAAEIYLHIHNMCDVKAFNPEFDLTLYTERVNLNAVSFVESLAKMYEKAGEVGKSYGMRAVFTIAPTASCSFKGRDSEGYTTSPEIAPPLDRIIDRESETMEVILNVQYHPDCEVAEEVEYSVHFRTACCIQSFMNSTGLAHSISFNWWSDKTVMNKDEIGRFLSSPLLSYYYALPVARLTQDKSRVSSEIRDEDACDFSKPCVACSE